MTSVLPGMITLMRGLDPTVVVVVVVVNVVVVVVDVVVSCGHETKALQV